MNETENIQYAIAAATFAQWLKDHPNERFDDYEDEGMRNIAIVYLNLYHRAIEGGIVHEVDKH